MQSQDIDVKQSYGNQIYQRLASLPNMLPIRLEQNMCESDGFDESDITLYLEPVSAVKRSPVLSPVRSPKIIRFEGEKGK